MLEWLAASRVVAKQAVWTVCYLPGIPVKPSARTIYSNVYCYTVWYPPHNDYTSKLSKHPNRTNKAITTTHTTTNITPHPSSSPVLHVPATIQRA